MSKSEYISCGRPGKSARFTLTRSAEGSTATDFYGLRENVDPDQLKLYQAECPNLSLDSWDSACEWAMNGASDHIAYLKWLFERTTGDVYEKILVIEEILDRISAAPYGPDTQMWFKRYFDDQESVNDVLRHNFFSVAWNAMLRSVRQSHLPAWALLHAPHNSVPTDNYLPL